MPIKSHKSKSKLPKAVNIPAKYSYQNMMKNHELKHANIQFRNDMLKARANAAYKNEYDRINSILHNHILHNSSPSLDTLNERKRLFKEAGVRWLVSSTRIVQKGRKIKRDLNNI